MNHSNYAIVEDEAGKPLVIKDLGPCDRYLSVTNDAEAVVLELGNAGMIAGDRRLFYIDSNGIKDEIIQHGGRFLGFAPGPTPRMGVTA